MSKDFSEFAAPLPPPIHTPARTILEYFTPAQKTTIAAMLSEGREVKEVIILLEGKVSARATEALKHLLSTPNFQNKINTILANEILALGMAKAWRVVTDIMEGEKVAPNTKLQAASWVRDTIEKMSLGRIGSTPDNLAALSKDELDVVLADARARHTKLLNADTTAKTQ